MGKPITPVLTLVLTLFLAACGEGGNTQNHNANILLPLSASSTPEQQDTPSQTARSSSPSHTESIESIAVDIAAANVYVLNVDSGAVLYEKNSADLSAPASTAKMLAALTTLEYCSFDEIFTVGAEIDLIATDSSKAGLNQGDIMTVRQLLAALLLPSGNDAAYTLAVNIGRKATDDQSLTALQAVESFVNAMNRKATEVGAFSSRFASPDGYDADGQYTTAYDLAQIAKACLGNDALSEIMGSYKLSCTLRNGREITYRNTNELLNPNSQYHCSYAVGLKTGNSGEGGSCLVSAAVIDGKTYICVVMGDSEDGRFTDSLAIFNEIEPILTSYPQNPPVQPGAPGGLERRNRIPGRPQ